MILTIKRIASVEAGTFGVFLNKYGVPFALTAERPWLDNAVSVSCIPVGTYNCKRVQSPKFGDTFEVEGVEGRTHILFHKGNIPMNDSHGCILIGETFDYLNGRPAVLSSKKGYTEFKSLLSGQVSFVLEIVSV